MEQRKKLEHNTQQEQIEGNGTQSEGNDENNIQVGALVFYEDQNDEVLSLAVQQE